MNDTLIQMKLIKLLVSMVMVATTEMVIMVMVMTIAATVK